MIIEWNHLNEVVTCQCLSLLQPLFTAAVFSLTEFLSCYKPTNSTFTNCNLGEKKLWIISVLWMQEWWAQGTRIMVKTNSHSPLLSPTVHGTGSYQVQCSSDNKPVPGWIQQRLHSCSNSSSNSGVPIAVRNCTIAWHQKVIPGMSMLFTGASM